MGQVFAIEAERQQRQAWEDEASSALTEAGMLREEAQEIASRLASSGWRVSEPRSAAMDELRKRGWSTAVDDEVVIKEADAIEVVGTGLE